MPTGRLQSDRKTRDIDFSTRQKQSEVNVGEIKEALTEGLLAATQSLSYGLDCRIQKFEVQPKSVANPTFASLDINIGYAYNGQPKHKRLMAGKSPTIISIDFSFNEQLPNIDYFEIADSGEIAVYSVVDLIAEKLRAFLQQQIRNRYRGQDIYDIHLLLGKHPDIEQDRKTAILESLLNKCRSRNIEPNIDSMNDPELIKRTKKVYPMIADQVGGELPNFDQIFSTVVSFYRSLDWPKSD